ncbi:MAG: flagellar basal body-associated FliL family protein [Spirochaetota bacterium]|mgnify:CR=1 FL=1|jgi:flagellar FliL protein|uniref:flagellar basal body-associated FliL family protein n=1 Tax=Gracilinema caldarium TaxID=215591 RepID=UPI0016A021EB|nr:flagellar basal body-associated FliL family protein [Gracilinema caldarium]NLJ08731.1 flagellar basal body protein FliL [Treponema sp.]
MAEDQDELNIDDSESTVESTPKKGGGLGGILPTILKFVAIGLGALIFIVTVSVITYRVMVGSGKPQTVATSGTDPYLGKKPELSWFTTIGVIRTRTKDQTPYSVVVNVIIGYDLNDKNAQTELTNRLYELKDFVRNFFSNKYAADLRPENERTLKQEIKQELNDTILQKAKAREILFQQLDVVEM